MRIDKYLWCVRLQKTRSKSSKFVEGGNVKIINEVIKKSSKEIKIDQTLTNKNPRLTFNFGGISLLSGKFFS